MNSEQFDDLTRLFAGRTSRRQVLKALGVTALAGLVPLLGAETAEAAKTGCKKDKDCNKKGGPGGTCCGGTCVNTQTDPNNGNGCGVVCCDAVCPGRPGQACGFICSNGVCECPSNRPNLCVNQSECTCTNVQTDPANCGSCFNMCASGQTCSNGTCTCPSCPECQVCDTTSGTCVPLLQVSPSVDCNNGTGICCRSAGCCPTATHQCCASDTNAVCCIKNPGPDCNVCCGNVPGGTAYCPSPPCGPPNHGC